MPAGEPDRRPDRVTVVYRTTPGIDAIDQHSRHVVAALGGLGVDADYVPTGLTSHAPRSGWILLQYQPFSYGRWGFAPALIRAAVRARRNPDVRLAVMVHEAWVARLDWRSALMGTWQRAQLRALCALADRVMTSTEALASALGPGAVHLPVPANINPVDRTPAAARAELGLEGRFALGLFGRAHESRALDHAEAAIAAVAQALGGDRLVILNLGADAPAVSAPPGVMVHRPGPQTPEQLSVHLWACDLVLLPFTDGVSTRRSTLMAALAHGRPVLGLRGPGTDAKLVRAPDALTLTAVGDRRAFARAAAALAQDPATLRRVGESGRRLYAEGFDWPILADRVTGVLGLPARRRLTNAVPTGA